MRASWSAASIALAAVLAAGCGHDECPQHDLHCYLEHMMLFPLEDDADQMPTKQVDATVIPPAADPPAVRITNVPPGAEYTTPRTLMPLEIGWESDECKQQPGFCFRLCLLDDPARRCTRKAECVSSRPGSNPAGSFSVAMGFLAEPEELRERFFAVITPVCLPGGDVAERLKNGGSGVIAGPPIVVEQIVPATDDPTGGVLPAYGAASASSTGAGGATGGGGAGGSGGSGGAGGG
jgi:hypothetical protein